MTRATFPFLAMAYVGKADGSSVTASSSGAVVSATEVRTGQLSNTLGNSVATLDGATQLLTVPRLLSGYGVLQNLASLGGGTHTLAANTWEKVDFNDGLMFDTATYSSSTAGSAVTVTSSSRLTANHTGMYRIHGWLTFISSGTNNYGCNIRVGGLALLGAPAFIDYAHAAFTSPIVSIDVYVNLTAGSYVELWAKSSLANWLLGDGQLLVKRL